MGPGGDDGRIGWLVRWSVRAAGLAALLLGLAALVASMAACVAVARTLEGAWIVAAVAATGVVAALPLLWGGGGAATLGARPDPRAARGLAWIAIGAALAALPGTAACAVVAHSAAAAGDNVVRVLYEQGEPWTWLAGGPAALSLAVFAGWWRGGRALAGGDAAPAEPAWRRSVRRSVPVVVIAASGAALLAAPPRLPPVEGLDDPALAAAAVASDASGGGRIYKWLHEWHHGSELDPIVFVTAIPPPGLSPAHGHAPKRHVALDSPRTLAALRTLRLAGAAARTAVPALCRLLARGDAAERTAVLGALVEIRPSSEDALAALDREWGRAPGTWTDRDAELLAALLDAVDPVHAEIVLVDALGSPARATREAAWEQLRMSLSRKAAPHVHHPDWLPAMLAAIDRRGAGRDAGRALVRLLQEPPDLCALEVDALLAACEHDDLRAWAVSGLDRAGAHAARALPAVRRALADPDPAVRRAGISTLQVLPADTESVLALRRIAAGDPDPVVRHYAALALESYRG